MDRWIFEYEDKVISCTCEKIYQSKLKEWIAKITDWTEHTPDLIGTLSSLAKERVEKDAIRLCKCRELDLRTKNEESIRRAIEESIRQDIRRKIEMKIKERLEELKRK